MVQAIGYSVEEFDPTRPGRLCRGRERWVEAPPTESAGTLTRIMISGATFTNETARDAERGLQYSGLSIGKVLHALFPNQAIVACCEHGHPRRVPEGATDVEEYELTRPGRPLREWSVRWTLNCAGTESANLALESGAQTYLVQSKEEKESTSTDEIRNLLYLLCGHGQEDVQKRIFQPIGIPELLRHFPALVLVHEDKHAPTIGIYCSEPLDPAGALHELAAQHEVLAVPFAIPPMLARWDRALWELRQNWDERAQGPFPVPPANSRRRQNAEKEEE